MGKFTSSTRINFLDGTCISIGSLFKQSIRTWSRFNFLIFLISWSVTTKAFNSKQKPRGSFKSKFLTLSKPLLLFSPVNASISFYSCCWISTLVYGRDGEWEVRVRGSIARRPDGLINSSPMTSSNPIFRLQHGCNHVIRIPGNVVLIFVQYCNFTNNDSICYIWKSYRNIKIYIYIHVQQNEL